MFRFLTVFITLLTSAFSAAVCDGQSVYDTNTLLYSQECASLYLNMSQMDYTSQMALTGTLTGFSFMFVTLMFVYATGNKR